MTITRNEITPGGEIGLYIAELAPDSPLEIWVQSEPRLLKTATADAAGEARVTVTIPEDLEIGQHELVVRATAADGKAVTQATSFVIRGAASPLDSLLLFGVLLLLVVGVGLIGFVIYRSQRKRRRRGF